MTDTPVLDLLASMTADSLEASSLDPETLMLVRIAALVAVDAAPISYVANLEASATSRSTRIRFAACSPQSLRSWGRHASSRRSARSLEALELELEAAETASGKKHEPEEAGGAALAPFPSANKETSNREKEE